MKKYKYFEWRDLNMGIGVGPALIYIEADSKEDARQKLRDKKGFSNGAEFISGDVIEVKEFIQPKPIEVIK
jgi:hypothetical protein